MKTYFGKCLAALLITVCSLETQAQGLNSTDLPSELQGVQIVQRLNTQLPGGLPFTDENGDRVVLDDLIGDKPVVLALVYYECPMLCNLILNGLLQSVKAVSFDIGKQYDVITVSIDPGETPALAAQKQESYMRQYDRQGAEDGWHFLTGSQESIKTLADSVGFQYYYDAERDEYVHAAAIMVVTPQGRLSRYFYGIEYAPRDLRLALVEASNNRIGNAVDQLLLYCFHYDPMTGKYGVVIMNVLRLTGTVTVLCIVGFMIVSYRRERRLRKRAKLAG